MIYMCEQLFINSKTLRYKILKIKFKLTNLTKKIQSSKQRKHDKRPRNRHLVSRRVFQHDQFKQWLRQIS